ncbi:hypothetical protein CPB84DRAFT_1775411 [Gymnopilus junonius]|uniref:Uncharacterized protein n=1 Tax=Gymnopilus junonius TaxID=109634 RepID=A0A9P5NSZ6_GYMJU|nr:hypothetical protein CPB84DRAFT_1775411 [Gymnopilus junonius]
MSFTDDDPLRPGTYAIINAKYKQQVQVLATSGGYDIVPTNTAVNHKWTVTYLAGKKRWAIQETTSQIFANMQNPLNVDLAGNNLATKNARDCWIIKHCRFQRYRICSASQPERHHLQLWLSSNNISDSSLWMFKSIEAEAPVLDGANPTVFLNRFSIYYHIYTPDKAICTKRPAFLNDAYVSCIRSTWLAPPQDARSLRHFLSSLENIDPSKTSLFSSRFSGSPLQDNMPIFLTEGKSLGATVEDPVVLYSKILPKTEMKAGTDLFVV